MLQDILGNAYPWGLVAVLAAAGTAILVGRRRDEEHRIRALGGRAQVVRTYLPLGLDFVYRLLKAAHDHTDLNSWRNFFETWGSRTLEANCGGERLIFTDEPENIKAVLATQFGDYGKGKNFHEEWREFLGDSIFTTDLDLWHHSRQLLRPLFIKDRVSDLDTFERHFQVLLPKLGGNGEEVDVKALFFCLTLDVATDFLLGKSVGSLDNPKVEFAESFGEVQRIQSIWSRAGPVYKIWPRRAYRRHLKVLDNFMAPFIEDALRLSPMELEKKTKSDYGYTFLHALASYTRDRKMLRDQIISVLLAGRDTTATTLSWTFYEIARQPAVVARLRQEIFEALGFRRAPTYDDLKSMKYLQHVMSETLRLYPAVPFNIRAALKDTNLPRGGGPDRLQPIGVLKDTPVVYATLTMHRRADLYPASPPFPSPEEFHPERWEGWTPKAWQFVPFNGGPRICIGQQFALTEMSYIIVRVLQHFDGVAYTSSDSPMPMKAEIILQPVSPVRVTFSRSQDDVPLEKGE